MLKKKSSSLPSKISPIKKKPFKKEEVLEEKKDRYVRTNAPSDEAIENLFKRGRVRGFITENEALSLFLELEDYVEIFEVFLDEIDRVGIHFVEMKEGLLGQAKEREDVMNTIRISRDKMLLKTQLIFHN